MKIAIRALPSPVLTLHVVVLGKSWVPCELEPTGTSKKRLKFRDKARPNTKKTAEAWRSDFRIFVTWSRYTLKMASLLWSPGTQNGLPFVGICRRSFLWGTVQRCRGSLGSGSSGSGAQALSQNTCVGIPLASDKGKTDDALRTTTCHRASENK